VEALAVCLAQENCRWGYDRIASALANLGYAINDQTVGNILKRHSVPPAPEREKTTTWKARIRTHLYVLAATDCFTPRSGPRPGYAPIPSFFSCILGAGRSLLQG
jgi:putative transposase